MRESHCQAVSTWPGPGHSSTEIAARQLRAAAYFPREANIGMALNGFNKLTLLTLLP